MNLTPKKIAARAILAAAITALLYWLDSDPWTDGVVIIAFIFLINFAIVVVISAVIERIAPRN